MKKQVKKEEIIEAAKKIIIEKGYKKTCVEDITNEVGIAKGSFYTYFKSKDSLMEVLLTEKEESFKRKLADALKDTKNLDETVEHYIRHYLTMPTQDLEFVLVMLKMMRNIDSIGTNVITRLEFCKKTRENEFIKILEDYIDEINAASKKDLERYGLFVFGMIDIFYINYFLPAKNKFREFKFEEINERVKKIDFENEINFMTKTILKMIKK